MASTLWCSSAAPPRQGRAIKPGAAGLRPQAPVEAMGRQAAFTPVDVVQLCLCVGVLTELGKTCASTTHESNSC